MGPKEFFPLLDFAFMPKNALPSRYVSVNANTAVHKRLEEENRCLSVNLHIM